MVQVQHKPIIWIIGHWGSCNQGDKYQPYVIAKHLLNLANIDVYYVNYSNHLVNGIKQKMAVHMNKKDYDLLGPLDTLPVCDLAILTTGSMDGGSPYVSWITDLMKNNQIRNLIVWGGFSRGYLPLIKFAQPLAFLLDDRVQYYARSYRDLSLYREIVNDQCKGRLAGDPMTWWESAIGLDFGLQINDSPVPCLKGRVVIPSRYSIWLNEKFWIEAINRADHVVCIDNVSDYEIALKYKAIILREPWMFIQAIKQSSHVISGRLHSGVLSACMGIPTTLIITDNSKPGVGSLKFDAVGNTSSALNTPICKVMTANEALANIEDCMAIPNVNLYRQNINKYKELTSNSLNQIVNEVTSLEKKQITSNSIKSEVKQILQINPTKPEVKPVPINQTKPEVKPVPINTTKPEVKPVPINQTKSEVKPVSINQTKSEVKPVPINQTKPEVKPAPINPTKPELKPVPMNSTKPEVKSVQINQTKPEVKPVSIPPIKSEVKPITINQTGPVVKSIPINHSIVNKNQTGIENKPVPIEGAKLDQKSVPVNVNIRSM